MEKIDKTLEYNQILGSKGLTANQIEEFNSIIAQIKQKAKENIWSDFALYLFWASIVTIAILPVIGLFIDGLDEYFFKIIYGHINFEMIDHNWFARLGIVWMFWWIIAPCILISLYNRKFLEKLIPKQALVLHRKLIRKEFFHAFSYRLKPLHQQEIEAKPLKEILIALGMKEVKLALLIFSPIFLSLSVAFIWCLTNFWVVQNDGVELHSFLHKDLKKWNEVSKIQTECFIYKNKPKVNYSLIFLSGETLTLYQSGSTSKRKERIEKLKNINQMLKGYNVETEYKYSPNCESLLIERHPIISQQLTKVLKGE